MKTDDQDGYSALQVGFGESSKRPRKPQEGLFKKLGVAPTRFVREIPPFEGQDFEAGQKFDISVSSTRIVSTSGGSLRTASSGRGGSSPIT